MKNVTHLGLSSACCFTLITAVASHPCNALTSFSENGIEDWHKRSFAGETHYEPTQFQNRAAIQAISQGDASVIYLSQVIDLVETPYINWSWLIKDKLPPLNELSKEGDDYVARVYVVLSGFSLFQTRSLNYVWSSSQTSGAIWDNAFAGKKVKMMALRDPTAHSGQWYEEKRNVYQDLIATFGDQGSDEANEDSYRYIAAIAIMTDTDNSQTEATAYYGDISFTPQ